MKHGMPIMTKMLEEPPVFPGAKVTVARIKEVQDEMMKLMQLQKKMLHFGKYQYPWNNAILERERSDKDNLTNAAQFPLLPPDCFAGIANTSSEIPAFPTDQANVPPPQPEKDIAKEKILMMKMVMEMRR